MKRLLGIKFVTRILWGLALFTALPTPQDCVAAPIAEIPLLTVDLGDWLYYKQAEFAFSIKNTGDADLEAKAGKTSCGCTVALPPEKAIPPGSEATIKLQYKPKQVSKRLGPQSFTAIINTNDPNRPEFLLSLNLRLVEPVSAYPPALEFEVLATADGLLSEHLAIKCFRDEELPKILSIESTTPAVTIAPVKQEDDETGKVHDYEVNLDPQQADSGSIGSIVIKTNSTRTPVLEVPIKVTQGSSVAFFPKTLLFGIVRSETTTEKSTHFTSSDRGLVPDSAVCSEPRITCKLGATPEGKWVIVASLKVGEAGARPERIDAAIEVLDKNQHKIGEVPVKAVVAATTKGSVGN